MEELTLTVPALLFPAISLILLAYTNRFLSCNFNLFCLIRRSKPSPSRIDLIIIRIYNVAIFR